MSYVIKDENGQNINADVVGFFKVDALNKEFVMYSFMDDNPNNDKGAIVISEVIREDNNITILDVKEEEMDLVVACYNEISKQVGE